jgi:heme exporter protein A
VRYGDAVADAGAELRARIGVLGHDLFLYPELTARENLEFFAGLHAVDEPAAAASDALKRAGLDARADDPVSSFSRGMRQRVALERALIHRPRLVLLDGPFTGLDDASASSLVARLRGCARPARSSSWRPDLELAEQLLDHALFLRDGRRGVDPRPAACGRCIRR